MNINEFFDESKAQSQVKSRIVSNYFSSWANVIKNWTQTKRLAYIDLFAGTGRYKDGTASTPLLVLDKVLASNDLRDMFVSVFVEKDTANFDLLQKEILSYPSVDSLHYKPKVFNHEVGQDVVEMFSKMTLVPSLLFADPCGYKGLSLALINSVVKDWACECVFFFNYNRINMGLENPAFANHMNAIFGQSKADNLRACIPEMNPDEREKCILSALTSALTDTYSRYVLPFRFEKEDGSRTSHYIVHVSKHARGYEIMKEIMARESTCCPQGVPSFEYSPAQIRQPLLFHTSSPLDDLQNDLLRLYAGRKSMMKTIYEEHNVGMPYVKKNYKEAMLQLERQGLLRAERKSNRPNTLGDNVVVQFLNQE